jgi:putative ABC transport system permease protein
VLNLFRYIGFRHLQFRLGRTILTSLGVALGVALFVAIQVINRSTIESFRESVESISGKSALVITDGETGFPDSKLDIVQNTPGVMHAVPMVETRAFFAGEQGASDTLTILGVDLLKEQSVRTYKTTNEEVIEDPLTFLNQPDSIILTHSFADAHHLKIDSHFDIATTQGKKRLTVRGLLTPEGPAKAYGGALAIMDIDGARMTFSKENKLDRIDVIPRGGVNVDDLRDKIQAELGPGYQVERPETKQQGMEKLVQTYQKMLSFFSTLALLVGIFLVTNSVTISVAERRREIGVLRAMGATRRGILILFLSEAFVMGAIGSVLGVWLGRLLASGLIDMVTQSLTMQYMTPIKASRIYFGTPEIVKGLIVGTMAAVVAALWPSLKAMAVGPLEAMKRVETNQATGLRRLFSWSVWLGVALLIFLKLVGIYHWDATSDVVNKIAEGSGIVAPALVGPGIVALLILAFRSLARKAGGTITRLAQDNLLQNPRRTGSNVTTLMVGLVLVIIIAALNISFRTTITDWFNQVLKADLLVSSYGKLAAYQTQPIKEEIGKELEKVPGVLIGPERGAYAIRFIHLNYGGKQIGMKAYDEPDPKTGYKLFAVQDRPVNEGGYDLYHAPGLNVFVSENFALHFQKKTGDVIDIDTPTGRKSAHIVGVIIDYASPEGVIYIDRAKFREIFNDHLVNAFSISAAPGTTPEQLRREIDQRFGRSENLMTVSNAEMKQEIDRSVDESFSYTRAIEAAALLVALLSLLNTFLISVMERTRELGMLRAVGMSRFQMIQLILQEALVQGGLGAIVAVGLGSWIAKLYISGGLSYSLGWIIHFSFPWHVLFTTVLLGVFVTFIAGFYPAWRAANIEIREALEYE